MPTKAVLLDWRGTLAMQPPGAGWILQGLRCTGLDADPSAAEAVLSSLTQVLQTDPPEDWDRQDTDAELHRDVHGELFRRANVKPELAEALYRLMSDTEQDVMAEDAPDALRRLAAVCGAVVIVSDIHVDLRPWFAARGLHKYVTDYVLSYEHGVQKPDAEIFRLALDAAASPPRDAIMVGDRPAYDGGAVSVGIPTLILPPLRSPSDRRLHLAVNAASQAETLAIYPTS